MSTQDIKVPDIGGAEGVEVIEICVAVGDQVNEEDSLVVLESDKASMEIPAPTSGKVLSLALQVGDTVSEGAVILTLEIENAEVSEKTVEASDSAKRENIPEPSANSNKAEAAATVTATTTDMTTETINVPDIGGAEAVDVIEVCIAVGDSIEEGDALIVLETDKASMEVPSPKAGRVVSITIKEGDKTSEGMPIIELEVLTEKSVEKVTEDIAEQTTSQVTQEVKPPALGLSEQQTKTGTTQEVTRGDKSYAGPAVRKMVRELGVDLEKVKGSGPRGRVIKEDIQHYVKNALSSSQGTTVTGGTGIPAVPAVDFARFGEIDVRPLSKIDKVTAQNMHRSWLNVPHVTQFDDVDITDLETFRQSLKSEAASRDTKITPLPFLLKACAKALSLHAKFNSSLSPSGEELIYKKYIHIGMAVDTPNGLVVPVIRDVDKKSIWELADETAALAEKAKNRKLKPNDMQGGCFTISSLGSLGGTGFTPIVNTPEVAILAISKLAVKPVWDGEAFQPRKMLPLSLSYDHRVINGGDAGRFFNELGMLLADIRRMIL